MIKYRADLLTTREAKGRSEERKIGRDDMIEKDVFEKLWYIYEPSFSITLLLSYFVFLNCDIEFIIAKFTYK